MIWAIGRAERHAGFTLAEMMVVLVLVGLIGAVAVLSLPSDQRDLDRQALALALALERASDEAVLSGTPVGLTLDQTGWRFRRYRMGRWLPISDGSLGPRSWSAPTALILTGEGGAALPLEEGPVPRLRFDALGQATPFRLELSRDGQRLALTLDRLGRGEIVDAR